MKKVLLGVLMATAMVACSKDETTQINRSDDQIKFAVTAENSSRAADLWCNNNKPGQFNVWAVTDGKAYFSGDNVELVGGAWKNLTSERYWPETDVDFYAKVGNVNMTVDVAAGTASFPYTVKDVLAEQEDILYSAKLDQKKKDTDGNLTKKVNLNFRHALSQVVFRAKNSSAKVYVEIDGVSVCHMNNAGTFTFGNASTDGLYENHTDAAGDNTTVLAGEGSWATLTGNVNYAATFTKKTIAYNADADQAIVNLTYADHTTYENANAMVLMPQKHAAWDVTATKDANTSAGNTYFKVKCCIYNVAGAAFDPATDVALWGTQAATKEVMIPVAIDWKPGKKYIYTFVFGEGNGGYEPDEDQNPDPILVPITFDITVDDFIPVYEDVDMGKN